MEVLLYTILTLCVLGVLAAVILYVVVISTGMTASANAELKFVALGADNNLGLRIDNIKLVGDK